MTMMSKIVWTRKNGRRGLEAEGVVEDAATRTTIEVYVDDGGAEPGDCVKLILWVKEHGRLVAYSSNNTEHWPKFDEVFPRVSWPRQMRVGQKVENHREPDEGLQNVVNELLYYRYDREGNWRSLDESFDDWEDPIEP